MTSPSSSVQEARKALGQRPAEIRKAAGLTKRALAQSLGRHESKASRFESGARAPSEHDLRDWCSVCGAESAAERIRLQQVAPMTPEVLFSRPFCVSDA
ncbi:helix-turn-helix domain-containing protein [Streptomyces sp. NPDC008092]|uniref:helix-turn-helix domain-containing protein n=1 Tax=Streptomyces sp. NPDC008092 TaxID=3364808 RepID=UPI0036EF7DA3